MAVSRPYLGLHANARRLLFDEISDACDARVLVGPAAFSDQLEARSIDPLLWLQAYSVLDAGDVVGMFWKD